MLLKLQDCLPLLRSPGGRFLLELKPSGTFETLGAKPLKSFPVVNNLPVLVDFADSVLDEQQTLTDRGQSVVVRREYSGVKSGVKRLLSPHKPSTRANVGRFLTELKRQNSNPLVLVVGGGSVGQGMEPLYGDPQVHIIGFDIFATSNIQFIADAHQMPLADAAVDAVIIQAVLEHVLEPQKVVAEIWRVLKPGGLVYAETPFMQQVHEAAYDFTRFTESGHRYLFRNFDLIASGASGGPGLQFMWSADYLARSVFRSRTAGKVAKLLFFWTQYLDRLVPDSYAIDAASGVYFFGRKSENVLTPKQAIAHYKGAQR